MRSLAWLSVLIPALAAGGTFVTGNTPLPAAKIDAKACANPDPRKCVSASDVNALWNALGDLRTSIQPLVLKPTCPSGLYQSDAAGSFVCALANDCSPSQAITKAAGAFVCQTVVTNPVTPEPAILRAFSDCEGVACLASGGRGGTIREVTNLNDAGPGSLRECIEATGPRVCVPKVGGVITLATTLKILNPYITIAGQAAPGGGLTLRWPAGGGPLNSDILRIEAPAHDVVIRYLRIRPGRTTCPGTGSGHGSAIASNSPINNIVLDHVSLSWGMWDNVSLYTTGVSHDIALSWSILAEPIYTNCNGATQGVNFSSSANTNANATASTSLDLHHNFFTTASHRNPTPRWSTSRMVNNLIYNWAYYASNNTGVRDIVANYFKPGAAPGASTVLPIHLWYANNGNNWYDANNVPSIYVAGNAGAQNSYTPGGDDWANLTSQVQGGDVQTTVVAPAPAEWKRLNPLSTLPAITSMVATDLVQEGGTFLTNVGASRRLDCSGNWVAARDSADAAWISAMLANSGPNPTTIGGAGTYPTISAGTACADADHDGMPDVWEAAQGLNPNDAGDAWLVAAGQVYTNLERYLNGP